MSGREFRLSFVIGAVDNLTYKVMEINQRVAKLTKPFRDVGEAFANLGRESGASRIGEQITEVGKATGHLMSAFLDIGKVLGGVGLAAAGAFRYFVLGAGNSLQAINDISQQSGISTTVFQGIQYAAAKAGFELDDLGPIMNKFSKNVGDAQKGVGESVGVFQAFGFSINDLKTMNMDQILARTGAEMEKIKNPALRNAVAMQLFGKEGAKLVEVLKDIPGSVNAAKAAGLIVGPEALQRADKFEKAWGVITLTLTRLRDLVGAEIMPVFTDMFQGLLVTINENKGAILDWAKQFAVNLPSMLKTAMSALQGFIGVMAIVGSVFNSIISFLGPGGVKFVTWGLIVAKLAGPVWGLITAVQALSLSLLTTPIGWIILGVAAIVLAIANWDKVMQGLLWTWQQIKDIATSVGSFFTPGTTMSQADTQAMARAGDQPQTGSAGNTVRTQGASGLNRTENKLSVDFKNVPKGVNIVTEKAEAPIDVTRGMANAFQF